MIQNFERGLNIAETNFRFLDEGAYGTIFVDRSQKRVRKIIRSRGQALDNHLNEVFNAEISAFEIAMRSDEISKLVPEYYCEVANSVILNREGADVSSEFRTDLAFEMEFLEHRFDKIGQIDPEEGARIRNLFQKCGILHMSDASVFLDGARVAKVIDFATREIELWA